MYIIIEMNIATCKYREGGGLLCSLKCWRYGCMYCTIILLDHKDPQGIVLCNGSIFSSYICSFFFMGGGGSDRGGDWSSDQRCSVWPNFRLVFFYKIKKNKSRNFYITAESLTNIFHIHL